MYHELVIMQNDGNYRWSFRTDFKDALGSTLWCCDKLDCHRTNDSITLGKYIRNLILTKTFIKLKEFGRNEFNECASESETDEDYEINYDVLEYLKNATDETDDGYLSFDYEMYCLSSDSDI